MEPTTAVLRLSADRRSLDSEATLKIATLFLLLVALLASTCFGGEPDASVLAVGDWSQPVANTNHMKLRGRLKICEYPNNRGLAPSVDVALYVELQEFSDSVGGAVQVYFDPQALKCELTDGTGKVVPQSASAFGGAVPGAVWINLPSYSSEVLRVTPFNGGGRMPDGGFELSGSIVETWTLKAGDTASYFLSGELTVKPPADHKGDNPQWIWSGTLKLPRMEVSIKKLRAGK
jgi:hypothetical protein